jgi:hypothetical protein
MRKIFSAVIVAIGTIGAVGSAAAETQSFRGCDGQMHIIERPHGNYAICMSNGPKLGCTLAYTKTFCDQKAANRAARQSR